jgi:hypothetical protein
MLQKYSSSREIHGLSRGRVVLFCAGCGLPKIRSQPAALEGIDLHGVRLVGCRHPRVADKHFVNLARFRAVQLPKSLKTRQRARYERFNFETRF